MSRRMPEHDVTLPSGGVVRVREMTWAERRAIASELVRDESPDRAVAYADRLLRLVVVAESPIGVDDLTAVEGDALTARVAEMNGLAAKEPPGNG